MLDRLSSGHRRDMFLFRTSAVPLLSLVLVGLPSVSSGAAEKPQHRMTADELRTVAPTKVKPVDINSGSIDQLRALPGINDFYAQNIIDGRPYQKKDDLVSRKIIPKATFEKIKDRIITVTAD
jgi:competence protein ComEA